MVGQVVQTPTLLLSGQWVHSNKLWVVYTKFLSAQWVSTQWYLECPVDPVLTG